MPKCLKPVYYLQSDPKWKDKEYASDYQKAHGGQTIGGAGCGITCTAMVIATLVPDSKWTPYETAQWSMYGSKEHPHPNNHGNYKATSGTMWEYFVPQMNVFNIPCKAVGKSTEGYAKVRNALRTGEYFVIASMAPGNWTSRGHYILAYYMDATNVYINDPASTAPNRTKNTIELFLNQAKGFWIISHKGNFKEYNEDEWDFGTSPDETDPDGGETITGFHLEIKDDTSLGKGNSSLVGYTNRTNDSNSQARSSEVNCITIHSAFKVGDFKALEKMIKESKTSYNYAVDRNGVIGLFIDEAYAANSTGDEVNDNRSVNIVCMNTSLSPKLTISKACKASLIDLCEDICRRRYITQLVNRKGKNIEQGTFTFHSQFQKSGNKTCPGSVVEDFCLNELIPEVNNRLNTENRKRVTVTSYQAESESYALRAQSTVSLGAINPYVARMDHEITGVNYTALQELGVVGIMFHSGVYFDTDHKVRKNATDIHFQQQMDEFKKSGVKLPFALEYWSRAISVDEAKLECDHFYYILAKYRPKLGAWVVCRFNKQLEKIVAQDIISHYYERFVQWGFKSKCGIIADKAHAEQIGWPLQSAYMPLWLEGEYDENIAPVSEVLTPSYFKLDDLENKGYNEDEDRSIVKSAVAEMKSQFHVSGGSSGGGGNITTSGGGGGYISNEWGNDGRAAKVGDEGKIPEPIPDNELTTYDKQNNPNKTKSSCAGKYRTTVAYEFGSTAGCYSYPGISSSGWPYQACKSADSPNGNVKIDNGNGIAYMMINGVKHWGAAFAQGIVGTSGDGFCVELTMSDKTTVNFVVLDTKNRGDAGSTAWGHKGGIEVTEIFLSTQHKSSYEAFGCSSNAYPTYFKLTGKITIKDLFN